MGIGGRGGGGGVKERVESEGRRERGGESEGSTRHGKGESLRMEQPLTLSTCLRSTQSTHISTHLARHLWGGKSTDDMKLPVAGHLRSQQKYIAPPPLKSMSGDKERARWDLFKEPARVHEKERGGAKRTVQEVRQERQSQGGEERVRTHSPRRARAEDDRGLA